MMEVVVKESEIILAEKDKRGGKSSWRNKKSRGLRY